MRVLIEDAVFHSIAFEVCAIDFHCILFSMHTTPTGEESALQPSRYSFEDRYEDIRKINEVTVLQVQHQGQHEGVVQRIRPAVSVAGV